jgi:hypothetical protein
VAALLAELEEARKQAQGLVDRWAELEAKREAST